PARSLASTARLGCEERLLQRHLTSLSRRQGPDGPCACQRTPAPTQSRQRAGVRLEQKFAGSLLLAQVAPGKCGNLPISWVHFCSALLGSTSIAARQQIGERVQPCL